LGPATKYPVNLDFFRQETPNLYYFLGFVAADGSICRKACMRKQQYVTKSGEVHIYQNKWSEAKIEIALKASDLAILEVFRNTIVPAKPIYYRPKTKAQRLSINDYEVVDLVESYGIHPRKTYNLTISAKICESPYFRHFIRGYFDGDGTIGIKYGRRRINGSVRGYYGIRARILGRPLVLECFAQHVAAVLNSKEVKVYSRSEHLHYIEYSFKTAKGFLEYIYQDANWKLERKYQQFMDLVCLDNEALGQRYEHRPQVSASL
jgi:hypothetical protein